MDERHVKSNDVDWSMKIDLQKQKNGATRTWGHHCCLVHGTPKSKEIKEIQHLTLINKHYNPVKNKGDEGCYAMCSHNSSSRVSWMKVRRSNLILLFMHSKDVQHSKFPAHSSCTSWSMCYVYLNFKVTWMDRTWLA